ncbi:MAG: hypothetical protein ACPGN3_02160 [Opitutales bacterium]
MKYFNISELKSFFKNRLDDRIDEISEDPDAQGFFVTHSPQQKEFFMVAVGKDYPCPNIYTLINESQIEGQDILAVTLLDREVTDSNADPAPSVQSSIPSDPDREKALDAREERIQRMEATLKMREKQLNESEEELKRIAEQQMEDLAREEIA